MPNNIYYERENLHHRPEVDNIISSLIEDGKYSEKNNFKILDVGGSWNPYQHPDKNLPISYYIVDKMLPQIETAETYQFDINLEGGWQKLENKTFDFCICTHTLEDIAYPQVVLTYMPKIADNGFIAVPSKYWELQRRQLFRGGHHHRWIFDTKHNQLILYPKINLIEYMTAYDEAENAKIIEENAHKELRMFWSGNTIDFYTINDDYLGPTFQDVVNMYHELVP